MATQMSNVATPSTFLTAKTRGLATKKGSARKPTIPTRGGRSGRGGARGGGGGSDARVGKAPILGESQKAKQGPTRPKGKKAAPKQPMAKLAVGIGALRDIR
ncbi:hypothetical protein EG327_000976 [Venturia inaequalis]|uniref:Uncharacterized protein n=1 Tax=Venturia inaequalis TaxID=5025 RepID=A0A8H3U8Z9_VENIN|nr:hypothetical protein EG327_000976 [Venturia inaequalis]